MKNNSELFTPLMALEEASRCLLCHDAPCSKECPAGTSPDLFIRSLFFRNLKGAAERIRENNILGGVCAYICPTEKYCKKGCSRCGINTPIQIDKLQQFLIEYERKVGQKTLEKVPLTKEKIAVIGSGPSGLTAASELAKKGYRVTIFEKEEKFGGWLRYGIPSFRLNIDILDYEIELIKDLGVEFKNNTEFGKDINLNLLKKEYDAILIATGKSKGKELKEFKKVNSETAVEFLKKLKIELPNLEDKKIIIIGGGDVAFDAACCAKKLKANVKMVALESLNSLPASQKEQELGHILGIPIFGGYKISKIEGNRCKFTSLIDKDEIILSFDKILLAIGQEESLDISKLKKEKGVFFSGDIVNEENTVVFAVKSGKEQAKKIIEYLEGDVKC